MVGYHKIISQLVLYSKSIIPLFRSVVIGFLQIFFIFAESCLLGALIYSLNLFSLVIRMTWAIPAIHTKSQKQYIQHVALWWLHPGGYNHTWVIISSKASVQSNTTFVSVLDLVILFFHTNSGNCVYSNSSRRGAEQDALVNCRSCPLQSISLNPDWVVSTDSKMLKVLPWEIFDKIEQKHVLKKVKNKNTHLEKSGIKTGILLSVLSNSMKLKKKKICQSWKGRFHFCQKCIESSLLKVYISTM